MKRVIVLIAVMLSLALCAQAEAGHTVEYYFENYCESCDPAAEFEEEFEELTGIDMDSCAFTAYNTATQTGRSALEQLMEREDIEEIGLPAAVVDGVLYQGTNSIRTELVETAFEWGGGRDSTVVYLYTPGCESCAEVEKVLAQLPEEVEVKRGNVSFISRVLVVKLDATQDPAAANALFEAYDVSDERRITPSVFLPEHALNGSERIEKYLLNLVASGQAVGEIELTDSAENSWSGTGFTALTAGIIAGFNGCALSMLLLITSLLLQKGRNTLLYGGIFLAAKFGCYLLIGFVLLRVMQRLNPVWLLPVSRWLLTAVGSILVGMNIYDAVAASRGELGQMKNQLPQGLRSFLHRFIRRMTERRILIPACILLGVVVAAGEFLCAGQIYLANLLQTVQRQEDWMNNLSLLLYCGGFILPSAVVLMLVAKGASANRIAGFMAEHIVLVKVLTALLMLALILLAWII